MTEPKLIQEISEALAKAGDRPETIACIAPEIARAVLTLPIKDFVISYARAGAFISPEYRQSQEGTDGERECGCQTAFTPFSGADAALFSAMCARKILELIASPPGKLTAFRWIPGSGGLEEVG